ncbi:HNH endonuclease family protein [Streptomyces niveus]|uniref:GmrSD restriction endonuclease domain-containing protein n=1 Tax=Streptomyces niveus TaxID=193462 RepID=UPI00084C7B86
MVPLAEAWDEGAKDSAPKRREAYVNDINVERSLVAVTAKTNRSKSDQDPAHWLPSLADTHCRYAADWIATKLRWDLTADTREINALRHRRRLLTPDGGVRTRRVTTGRNGVAPLVVDQRGHTVARRPTPGGRRRPAPRRLSEPMSAAVEQISHR